MKKTLALFVLMAVSVAAIVFTAVHGQNDNSNSSRFRRTRAEKRIANQYIVVLKDDVEDVEGEATRLSRIFGGDRNETHTYHRALKGFPCACRRNKRRGWLMIRVSPSSKKIPLSVWAQLRPAPHGDSTASISGTCRSTQPIPSTPPVPASARTSSTPAFARRTLNSAALVVLQLRSTTVSAPMTVMVTALTSPAQSAVQPSAWQRTLRSSPSAFSAPTAAAPIQASSPVWISLRRTIRRANQPSPT